MQKSLKNNSNLTTLLCVTTVLSFFSCTGVESRNDVSVTPSYPPPITVFLDTCPPPAITELKNVPSSVVITVPKTSGGSYIKHTAKGEENIKLLPPVVTNVSMPVAHFTNFNTEDGLALSTIICGWMDKKGRLWFGTPGGGVSCYDGKEFTNYSESQGLSTTEVTCISEDKSGNIWFGTGGGGVCSYDGFKFTNYTTRDGLADDGVFDITLDKKGILWFATNNGVSRFDGTKFNTIDTLNGLPSNYVNEIVEDARGNLWISTFGGGVCRYDGNKVITFTAADGLPTNHILCLLEDSKGNLWIGTHEGGVSLYDGKKIITFTTAHGLAHNTIQSIAEDKDGIIWLGTTGGISSYDGEKFTTFTTSQGLPYNSVSNIITDQNGNLWFGTMGGGLSRYNGKALSLFTAEQGLPQGYITQIAEDKKGNIWIGTWESGLICYDGKNFTYYTTSQGLPHNNIAGIISDRDSNLWIGSGQGGISRFDGKSFTTYTTKQSLANIVGITQVKNGDIWIATPNGASRFDGKEFTTYTTAQGLGNDMVRKIAEDAKGNLWFATYGGVSRFDGKNFTNYTTAQGLANNYLTDILLDKSANLWFASDAGVSRYDGTGFTSFNTSDGLPDNMVYNIAEDEKGVIWLGTNEGFCSLKFKTTGDENETSQSKGAGLFHENNEQLKKYKPVWEIYNNQTGYPVKDMMERAFCISQYGLNYGSKKEAGMIWAPCGDGKVIRFDPNSVSTNLRPPGVVIKSIKINEESINWYSLEKIKRDSTVVAQQEAIVYGNLLPATVRDSLQKKFRDIQFNGITPFYQLPEKLVLPFLQNHISFDFVAIETSRNFMVRYQYILEGYDREWSPITEKTSVSFGNISEGIYTFKLKARSPEGVWSHPVTYTFEVLPPWWRTWWFRILEGIGILAILYGFYRWRTAALVRHKRMLEQTVKERTAEVVKQKEKSDELLLNILPFEVAEELKEKGYTSARYFDEVTALFSDIKGFSTIAEKMTPRELVQEINIYFSAFDKIIQNYGLEKIKTIGDAYIAAGGLPEKNSATAKDVIEAALSMQEEVGKLKEERSIVNKPYFELRIGIHTGPVVAGVVGIKKFQYDIWGDTVNLAARMEQSGVVGKINISQHTYELIKEHFTCIHRGKIDAKNKGEIDMYFVG